MSSSAEMNVRVAGHALGQPGVAVDGRVRQLLGQEAALGADRHDDGVLHRLRLDQAEHLGAEVLAAVRPAQPAAGDQPEAQVHALDPRAVDQDLEARPRRGQVGDGRRVELERQVRLGRAVRGRLEEVGAQGGLDQAERGSAGCGPRRGWRPRRAPARWPARPRRRRPARSPVERGSKRRLEQLDEQPGDAAGSRRRHCSTYVLAEGRAGLAQVAARRRAARTAWRQVSPATSTSALKPVALGLALPDRGEGVLEALLEPLGPRPARRSCSPKS